MKAEVNGATAICTLVASGGTLPQEPDHHAACIMLWVIGAFADRRVPAADIYRSTVMNRRLKRPSRRENWVLPAGAQTWGAGAGVRMRTAAGVIMAKPGR